jgi:DNA-binding transcriptional ArsR family regulator
MLDRLRAGPCTTGALAEAFPDLTRFAVMQHLTVLVAADLVLVQREGRERWNHLNAVPIQRLHDRWVSRYEAFWALGLDELRRRAERPASVPRAPRPGARGTRRAAPTPSQPPRRHP